MKKFFATTVIAFLALGFLAPFSVQAQSGRKPVIPLCFFKAVQGDPYVQYATTTSDGAYKCPTPETGFQLLQPSAQTNEAVVALCWKRTGQAPNYQYEVAITYEATVAGQPVCDSDLTNFITRTQFRPASSSGGGGTGNNNQNNNNGGNGNGNGNGNQGNGNGNSGGSGDTDPQIANCSGDGFEAVGPLCLPKNPFANSGGVAGSGSISDLIVRIIKILLFFAGIVAVIMVIIGGYLYMTARGNDLQATNGRKTLTNAIIGLVIVVLAYVIVQAVYNFLIK